MVSGERLSHNVHGRNRESTGEIMKVSTKGRYALRIMIDLAEHNTGEYIRLKDISKRQGITLKYMEQIMPILTKSGYVKSFRGNNGGYMLAKKTRRIYSWRDFTGSRRQSGSGRLH